MIQAGGAGLHDGPATAAADVSNAGGCGSILSAIVADRSSSVHPESPHAAHGHGHDHGHHHGQGAGGVLLGALVITLGFAAVEAIAGWWSGSLALLGDAGHMLTDAVALGLAAVAAWVARQPPTLRHSYGMGRAEVVAGLTNGVFMLALVAVILAEAVSRLRAPPEVQATPVMVVATVGLGVNLLVAWLLHRDEQTLNTRAALLHVLGDLLGSVAALVSGLVIALTGWTLIDPLLSMLICGLIAASSVRLVREALHVLMEGVPAGLKLGEVGRALAANDPRVLSVHDLHIWSLSSGQVALSAHVVIDAMESWDHILQQARDLLHERYGIDHVTLQPETGAQVIYPMPR
jgi:cobalt-zinc-cadmium efflux system protein